jgi:diaminopimelate decarboxylase
LFGEDIQLITEFGRAIHANCGLAVSRVEYVKPAQRLAVIHLGADFLLRPVYRPEDWKHEFFVLDANGLPKSGAASPVTIAGPLCFSGDVVARDIPLPPIEPGDWIVIRDVGAYTLSMWSRHCSRGIPAVIGYDPQSSGSLRVLRHAETPADVVRFWS